MDGQLDELAFNFLVNGIREHIDRIHKVMSIIHSLQVETILDLGCNYGLFGALSRWGHQPKKFIVGVDKDEEKLKFASRVMQYDRVVTSKVEDLKWHEKFDLVICMEILEHVKFPSEIVNAVARHSGKWALFSTPIELQSVDGKEHIRHVAPNDLYELVGGVMNVEKFEILPSEFCEKPKWQGWCYVLATVKEAL